MTKKKNQTHFSYFRSYRTTKTLLCIIAVVMVAVSFYIYKMPISFVTETPLPPPPASALFHTKTASPAERANDLLSRMTLDEKIGQMALVEKNSIATTTDIASYGIGALLSGAGAKPQDNTANGWLSMVENFVTASQSSRLGIPILYGIDAIHGHSNVPGATVFPHAIGIGATGDADLTTAIASATRDELLATGINWNFAPTLDLPQDIRWGRTYETFSDDPLRTSALASAYVKGLQGTTKPGESKLALSTLKHYIGAGSMKWNSSSNKNFHIDQGTTVVDEQALRSTYLQPFTQAINTGAGSVMVGLSSWGDTKLAAQKYLITDVLKGELAFSGFVVSDWYGVYEIPGGTYAATVLALNAGVDMVMLPFDYKTFIKNVRSAVAHGDIPQSRIDDAVRRILTTKFELGLFEAQATDKPSLSVVGNAMHRALARKAVSESLVLLKNNNATLPISKSVRRIVVAGSAADNIGRQSGVWTVEWRGIDGNWLPGATSILSGIRANAGNDVDVSYDLHGNFAPTSPQADIGIAIVGETPYAEGWGDTANPTLTTEDIATIEKVKKVSKKVLVIIVSGRPLMISHELPTWDATIAAWLPGSEGGGVADVLFGDTAFTGTLPLPWPDHSEQLPISVDGHTADGTAVLFPRYFGRTK